MNRLLAIVWDPRNLQAARTLETLNPGLAADSPLEPWVRAYQGPGAVVLRHRQHHSNPTQVYSLGERRGVIIGRLFERRQNDYSTAPKLSFDEHQARRIVESAGQCLIDDYWGTYLAVICDEAGGKCHVFRDPVGTLPCYFVSHRGVNVFCTHIEDAVRLLPGEFPINRGYLARWLFYPSLMTTQTGLENVSELPAGERLTFERGTRSRVRMWNPVTFASGPDFSTPEQAAQSLRSTLQSTVNAWASCYGRITHRLSGGLDSSILAACLAHAPSKPELTFLNLSIDVGFDQLRFHRHGLDKRSEEKVRAIAGHGDERYFARLVAKRWNVELVQRQRDLSMDLRRLWNVRLTTAPSMYFTQLEMDDAELELVQMHRPEAFFSGQAGDSVLLATLQALPAIDYARLHGLRRGLWHQIVASCALSKDSLWSVLGKTLASGLLRRPYVPPLSILDRPTLLNRTFTPEDFGSSIVELPNYAALPPGKQNHVRGVAWSAYHEFVFGSGQYAEHIDPLNSQPLWELLLRLPTYTLLAGGVSRGLARRAFADVLPSEIRRRQVKGTGGPFYQHLLRRNKALVRETLLDGLLVKENYFDRHKLDVCLSQDDPSITVAAHVLLCYLAAEIWLRQWRDVTRGNLKSSQEPQRAIP